MDTTSEMPGPCPKCLQHTCQCNRGKFGPFYLAAAAVVIAGLLVGCAHAIYDLDITSASDGARASARSYELLQLPEAGIQGARANDRAAYCSSAAILRRHDATIPEAGIDCPSR